MIALSVSDLWRKMPKLPPMRKIIGRKERVSKYVPYTARLTVVLSKFICGKQVFDPLIHRLRWGSENVYFTVLVDVDPTVAVDFAFGPTFRTDHRFSCFVEALRRGASRLTQGDQCRKQKGLY